MKTAANGGLLFVNVIWHSAASPYGCQFDSPLDVARFVDRLCLGLDSWFWTLDQSDLRVYAPAPFTTLSPQYAQEHANTEHHKANSKNGAGHAHFCDPLLSASIYFTALVDELDEITPTPGTSPSP